MIYLEVKLTLKAYKKLNFIIAYKSPIVILATLIGIMNIIWVIIFSFTDLFDVDTANLVFPIVFGVFTTFGLPFIIYRSSIKGFNSNNYLQETVFWTITDKTIKLKGTTFESEYDWSNVSHIKKLKNWTLLYKSKIIANIIPNQAFQSKSDMGEFWQFVKMNNIKVK